MRPILAAAFLAASALGGAALAMRSEAADPTPRRYTAAQDTYLAFLDTTARNRSHVSRSIRCPRPDAAR